ncbi:hypothetical protein [Burkholderia cenocepacia]|uniref:hypothetical protein n=1 Tax=Burkholderia cenocepacia TaxID=95486 RepID=UPI002AB1BBFB|nr:hypothetical protein [Burkholderia cenocepacia]
MNGSSSADDLLRRITDSAGAAYLNRAHQRTFSLNVFQMNALELMEAAQRVKDPDQGMALMMEKNREAGLQAHRELNRHVHNFVSSALTLVEHTRVFMRKHYADTDILATYEKQVAATFAQSPVAQYVQGLRNYMLHRGLPKSSMFMQFTSNPGAANGSGTAETGVHYETASLLDWKDWKPVARIYLEQAGEQLDVHEFAQDYLTLVNQFHSWLNATLAEHHRSDIQELSQLQAQLQSISPMRRPASVSPAEGPGAVTAEPFIFTATQITELDQTSSRLQGKIRELHVQQAPQGFPTERPTTTITDSELIGAITGWGQEASGESAFMFIHSEGKTYGLSQSDYIGLDGLIDAVMKSSWARSSLSRKFVEEAFVDWARQRFEADGPPFSEMLRTSARERITTVEVWAPIANMEIEQGFHFGPVRVEPITAAVMENLRNKVPPARPEQEHQVAQLFEKLRKKIQGYAAVVVSMEAEPTFAQERGLRIAQDTVDLLRFFSPAAPRSFVFSPVALTGAEYIPASTLIVLREGGFALNQGVLPEHVGFWRLPAQQISEFQSGLVNAAGSLVLPEGLNEFALAVRASIVTYSKGTTLVNTLDRLRNCLSALEGVLLRHEMEPRAHSVANRMSFVLARGGAEREAVKQIVRQIYWLQEQPQLMAQSRREDELITVFTSYAYDVLCVALRNTPTFSSKVQFVTEVDRAGVSCE